MIISEHLINLLAVIGLLYSVHVISILIKSISFYLKHKKLPKNLLEEKLELLQAENLRLSERAQRSEREAEEMTKAIITKLR
jgi:hypothetical protein